MHGNMNVKLVFAVYTMTSRHNTTTSALMVSTHTWHLNMQLSAYNFISILYFKIDFKLLFKTLLFIFVN